jgi:glycosyltransferase involved in cell wall biosynthesis
MTENPPAVTVIIPTYNRSSILSRAIDSVLNQTFADFELIVVDDASTDDTEAVVRGYDDKRVRYICHEINSGNGGIARNTAIERSDSEYVAFLDDDDVWLPEKLERQVDALEQCDDRVGLIYCWMDYYDGDELVERSHPTRRGDIFREMLDKNAITAASTIIVRRRVLKDVGNFDGDVPRGIDSDFIRRVARDYHVDYVPEVLVEYNIGHGYDRDSEWDESGLRAAIESTKIKHQKFTEAFERNPQMYASTLAYIGACYGMLGEVSISARYFWRAFKITPLSTKVYFQLARIGKFYVDRHLPRLGRAIDKRIKT